MSFARMLALWLLAFFSGALAAQPAADRVEPEIIRLPLVINGQPTEVVAHLYKPRGDGPFPLVIHSHGRAGTPVERTKLEYPVAVGHGNYWLRKGVAVIAPVRPGYGATGGGDVENSGARWQGNVCIGKPDFMRVAESARRTVVATHEWALRQPWVRKDRILVQGQSVGGLTAVATAALNLPGVVGTVNFAGGAAGYPEISPGKSCDPAALEETYRALGRQARGPSLWLYAQNDLYWGADAPKAWHEAYRAGGSDTQFVATAPVANHDGHQLLLHGGRLWSVPLEAFIRKVGLTAP